MITKAIIKRLNTNDDNHFKVYIPLLRTSVDSEEKATIYATALCISGINNNYKVNDVVYVGFEDNQFDRPVILGKLLTNKTEEVNTTIEVKSIVVDEKCKLPRQTTIGNNNQNKLNIATKETIETVNYDNEVS